MRARALLAATLLPLSVAHASRAHPVTASDYAGATSAVMPARLTAALRTMVIPSYARQTKLACSACHYQFPQLTPFGRLFKLNGYTMTGLTVIKSTGDSTKAATMELQPIGPVSAMFVVSLTHLSKMPDDAQNNATLFPEQASIFLGGALSPHVGAFSQFTYAQPDAAIGLDNVDLRYSNRHSVGKSGDVVYGITLHNNPTVQDVWNTVPAWSYPFMGNSITPEALGSSVVDGALGQSVLGLGAYGLWNSTIYTEVTAYRSAAQGTTAADANSTGALKGITPYWRLALQHQFSTGYLEIGTYGLTAKIWPEGVTGPTDHFTDIAGDAQFEHPMGTDHGVVILRSTLIHESRTLDATFAADASTRAASDLTTARLNGSFEPSTRYGFTLGVFETSGRSDPILYGESANGSPKTSGFIGEFQYNPWENTRVALQYTGYGKFNGGSTSYDGNGRNASDNNSIFLYTWIAF